MGVGYAIVRKLTGRTRMDNLVLVLTPNEVAALRLFVGRLTIGGIDNLEAITGFRKLFKELDRLHEENVE